MKSLAFVFPTIGSTVKVSCRSSVLLFPLELNSRCCHIVSSVPILFLSRSHSRSLHEQMILYSITVDILRKVKFKDNIVDDFVIYVGMVDQSLLFPF